MVREEDPTLEHHHKHHTFVRHAVPWQSLFQSNHYAFKLLDEVLETEETTDPDKEERWYWLVREYEENLNKW